MIKTKQIQMPDHIIKPNSSHKGEVLEIYLRPYNIRFIGNIDGVAQEWIISKKELKRVLKNGSKSNRITDL